VSLSLLATLEWIEHTDLSMAIREGALLYPVLGGAHVLAIALFGGMLVVTDLRLLGWVMARRPVSEVLGPLAAWKRAGFVVVTASGLLLAWAEPLKLSRSPSFWIKMGLFALVGAHALIFHGSVYRDPRRLDARLTLQGKCAAVLSLILWAGLIISGRMIGFDS
jgi:hypothetical protein